MWDTLRKNMRGRWRAQRLEDKCSEGIPDLCYALPGRRGLGFIELKYKAAWPKRASTPLRLRHYTQQQRIWLRWFGAWAAKCFLLLQVGNDYLLFGWEAAQQVGELPREALLAKAAGYWRGSIDLDEFTELLT